MKQIQAKNKPINKSIAIISIALLIGGLTVLALEKSRITNFIHNPFSQSPTGIAETEIDRLNKADETAGSKDAITTDPNVDTNKNTAEIPTNTTGSLSLTTLEQTNGKVTYSAVAASSLNSNGTCTAVFEKDNTRPVTRSTTATNHTCGPVDIPEYEFASLGEWKVTIRYFTDNSQVSINDRITIQ